MGARRDALGVVVTTPSSQDPAIPHVPCTNLGSEPGHDTCIVLFSTGPARWCHTHRSRRGDCPATLRAATAPTPDAATTFPSPHLVRMAAEALYGGTLDPDPGSADDVCACQNAKSAAHAVLRIAADDVAARESAAELRGADAVRSRLFNVLRDTYGAITADRIFAAADRADQIADGGE